jgi:hypothetical protein
MNIIALFATCLILGALFILWLIGVFGLFKLIIDEYNSYERNYLTMLVYFALLLLLLSLPLFTLTIATNPAKSQQLEMPTYRHNPDDPNHWYPESCCNLQDCEPTPIDAITEDKDGYTIKYYSERFRQEFKGWISHNDPKIQPSQDGGYHACWVVQHPDYNEHTQYDQGGPTGGAMGFAPMSPIRCFFTPRNT